MRMDFKKKSAVLLNILYCSSVCGYDLAFCLNEQSVFYFGFFLIDEIHDPKGSYQSLKMTKNTP